MRITKSKERWFNVPDDEDKAKVLIRKIPPGEMYNIVDKAFQHKIEYHKDDEGNLSPVMNQITDRKFDREQTVLQSVRGWENFFDQDGTKLAYNAENVLRAIREIDGFVEFVNECRTKLNSDLISEESVLEKNS